MTVLRCLFPHAGADCYAGDDCYAGNDRHDDVTCLHESV